MSLLLPDAGLLFWMIISFSLVFFILARYGFPVIVKMVEDRKAFIQKSIDDAKESNAKIAELNSKCEAMILQAREEQIKILREANQIKENIISSAKIEAREISSKEIAIAKKEIEKEREASIKKIRVQIAQLSVDIAEKIVRTELHKSSSQMEMINRFLDETSEMKS
jgi:F-type H+-transporting ATPase subunit b